MLPYRQVHLDFHTSPFIPEVGIDFNPLDFVATLRSAHVNSITVFAKCHHGYAYYPTRVGTPHPHLQRDLLGEMIQACHAAGIRTPVYITTVWDELAWASHPEWRQITPDGRIAGVTQSLLSPGWKNLCLNTGYLDYVAAQVDEVMDLYDGDGWFVDILKQINGPCLCTTCLAQMQAEGIDPQNFEQLLQFSLSVEQRFMERLTQVIRAKDPNQTIFYNGHLAMTYNPAEGNRPELDNFTHLEIESLPGGQWGYAFFPWQARFFQTFDRQLLAMNGRFHTTWGDFGGLRNRAALEFECFRALALGAGCSIGDQLHPRGRLNPAVYQRIGEVYAQVERRESWCFDTRPLAEIGVLTTATLASPLKGELVPTSDLGALNVLEQLHYQFQVLDGSCDLSTYRVVILPDCVSIDPAGALRLRRYLAHGGKLLITGNSGLSDDNFILADEMGVDYQGPAPFTPDYLALEPELQPGIEPMEYVCELPGAKIQARLGTQILAWSGVPYFNRTWEHFCSHQYTPLAQVSQIPVITQFGNVIYVARPLFREYAETSRRVHKQVLANCLKRLLPHALAGDNNLPSTALLTVRHSKDGNLLVHLLHYIHQRRGNTLDIIEDVLPLVDVQLSIRSERRPAAVQCVPELQSLEWTWADGYISMLLPRLNGYQIIQITYPV